MKVLVQSYLTIVIALLLISCSSTEIKTTHVTKVIHESNEIPETELLDIGIKLFNPGLEQLDQDDNDDLIFPEIRMAESSYFSYLLMEALQSSNAWGAVRVVPDNHHSVDVLVKGKIILSDGEMLMMMIDASDASGQHWFKKKYTHKASRYSYSPKLQHNIEPFQTLYNQIANDLNNYRKTMKSAQLIELRQVSQLKYAKLFAPQLYSQYLIQNSSGKYSINRLPAAQDPMMERIRQIRERDYLFVDTLQQYYDGYAKEMKQPYQQWRRESYNEIIAMRKLQRKASNEKILGAVAIIAGIAGAGSSKSTGRVAGAVAVSGGAYILKDGFERAADSQIHIEALQELGDSLEASIEPHVIELEDRTVTLTGTVNDQYKQWRNILQNIYQINLGNTQLKESVVTDQQ